MKCVWLTIRLLLPVAAIVMLTLSMLGTTDNPNLLLAGGLLCSCLGLWLNIWFQRKERKKNG